MSISDSRFNMWRAVAAMIHADGLVLPHEINFIIEGTRNISLSESQREILMQDLQQPGDIETHFRNITLRRDKEDFFHFARAVAWSDGDFDDREKALIQKVRLLPGDAPDVALMEGALQNFRGLYIEGGVDSGGKSDPAFLTMIKGLLRNKKAA